MKSTKKIFVVALAALMLVAFTACQANTIPTQVRAITGITGPDYLVGQTFDAKDFTVTVQYTDGTSEELNGSGIVALADGETFPASAGTYDVVASIGNASTGNYNLTATAKATGTFYVYNVTSIEVTTAPTTVTFEEGKTLTDADLAGIVVTATYGKSKTVELDASEYALSSVSTLNGTSTGLKVPGYAETKDDGYKALVCVESSVGGTAESATYEIAVTEGTKNVYEMESAPVVMRVTALDSMPDAIYYGQSTTEVTNNIEVRISDNLSTTWSDADSVVVTNYTVQWGAGVTNNRFEVAGTALETPETVNYVVVVDYDGTRLVSTTPEEVSVYNYVTSVVVTEGLKLSNAVKGEAIQGSSITLTGTLAYDSNPDDSTAATVTIPNSDIYFTNYFYSGAETETVTYVDPVSGPLSASVPVEFKA